MTDRLDVFERRYLDRFPLLMESVETSAGSQMPSVRVVSTTAAWNDRSWMTVVVVANFGAVHLRIRDAAGAIRDVPEGTTHFLEHLVFWNSFDSQLVPLEKEFFKSPNAVVTHNQTIWYLPHVTNADPHGAAVTIVHRLLKSLFVETARERVDPRLLAKVRRDVENELSYRRNDPGYVDLVDSLGALFPDHPIRHDILGSELSMTTIDEDSILLALKALRATIRSVNVIGVNLQPGLGRRLLESVASLLADRDVLTTVVDPVSHARPLRNVGRWSQHDRAVAFVGLRLEPFQREAADDRGLRGYLAEKLCCVRPPPTTAMPVCVSWPTLRGLVGATRVDPWFYIDPERRAQAIEGVAAAIAGMFSQAATSRWFENMVERQVLEFQERWHFIALLASAADLFGWRLIEALDTFTTLTRDDCARVAEHITASKGAESLAYKSPYFGFL